VRQRCNERRRGAVKVASAEEATAARVAGVDAEGAPRRLWHHPSGVAVTSAPERVFDDSGEESDAWMWQDAAAGSAMSTIDPELLLRVESIDALAVGDEFRWMSRATHALSGRQTKLHDVGGASCCAGRERCAAESGAADVPEAGKVAKVVALVQALCRDCWHRRAVEEGDAHLPNGAVELMENTNVMMGRRAGCDVDSLFATDEVAMPMGTPRVSVERMNPLQFALQAMSLADDASRDELASASTVSPMQVPCSL
jgi:hypothetical protein